MDELITVTGAGTAGTTPDVLRVTLRVDGRGADVGAALDAASAALVAVLAAVRSHGAADADIATQQIDVHPRFNNNGQRLGFESSQSVVVLVRDVDRGGDLLRVTAAAAPDALSIDSVALAVADPGPVLTEARTAAFADARAKAEQYAGLAGRRLGAVVGVSEESAPRPVAKFARGIPVAAAAMAVPIETGTDELAASVTVSWQLLD